MPIEVDVPDVGLVEFPDEMSTEDIGAALGKQFGKPRITRGMTPTARIEPKTDLSRVRLPIPDLDAPITPSEQLLVPGVQAPTSEAPERPWEGQAGPTDALKAAWELANTSPLEGLAIDTDPKAGWLKAGANAAVNAALSIPIFMTSPVGATAGVVASVNPATRAAAKWAFRALMAKQAAEGVSEFGKAKTPAEKATAAVNAAAGAGGLGWIWPSAPPVAPMRGPLAKVRLLKTPKGAKPSPAAEAVGAVSENVGPIEGEPTTALTPEAEAAVQATLAEKPPTVPPSEPPPPPAPEAVPKPPTPAPAAPGAAAAKPEVATLGTDTVKPNNFGDPGGTTYYGTPQDWAEWQQNVERFGRIAKQAEAGDFSGMESPDYLKLGQEREDIKNKYGGNPPKPPRAPAAPAAPAPAPSAPPPAQGPGIVGKAVSALEAEADKARARIVARRGFIKFGSGPLAALPDAADYALVGAAKLARFGLDKGRFVADMVKEFGERIRPHLDRLYDDARAALIRYEPSAAPEVLAEQAKERLRDLASIRKAWDRISKPDADALLRYVQVERHGLEPTSKSVNEMTQSEYERPVGTKFYVTKEGYTSSPGPTFDEVLAKAGGKTIHSEEIPPPSGFKFYGTLEGGMFEREYEVAGKRMWAYSFTHRPDIDQLFEEWFTSDKKLTPDEAYGQMELHQIGEKVKQRKALPTDFVTVARLAFVARKPVNASLIEWPDGSLRIPGAIPEGYVREGDRYVYKPAAQVTGEGAAAATPPPAQGPGIVGKAVSALEAQADKARARIVARRGGIKFGSGPLAELPNAADYALVGAAKLARFGLDKARFVADMVKEFGERIRPHLDRLYDDARAALTRSARIAKAQETPVQDIIRQAVPIAPAKSEAATQVIDTMQSSIRTARALRDHFTGAPKVSRAEVKAADDWLEADANRIRDSLTELVKTTLPVAERGRFITAINNATKRSPILTGDPEAMYRHAAEVAGRIEDRAVEVRKAGVANEIKAAVTKAMDSPGVDIGYKQRILAAVQRIAFSKPTAATARALKATRDYLARMEASGQDVDMPRDVLDSLDVLHQIPAGELPLHVIEALRDKVNQLANLGRMKVKARRQVWEIEKNAKIRELNQERTNPLQERPEMRQQPGDPRPLSARIRNFINRRLNAGALADKAILPQDPIFDLLGDAKGTYRGWLFRHFRNPIDLDYNAAGAMLNRLTAPIDAIIKKHNLGRAEAERIGVFAASLQEGGMDRLIETGVKPETIDHILKTITPNELSAYQAMRAALDAIFPEIQKLMHDLYNIDVKKGDMYFPWPREWNQYEPGPAAPKAPKFGADIDLDELAGWKAMMGDYLSPKTTKTERGFTITRKPGAATPIKLNAFDVFYRHMNDATYLLKTQRDIKMMGEMARGDLFRAKYGKVGQNLVLSWLDTVARQGQVSPLQRWHGLDTLRRNTTVGVIGFRIASQFKHASNIPLGMWRAGGPEWWRSGLAESLSERGDKFMRENFVETFTRGGAEPALVEASERDVTAFGRTVVPKKIIKSGFAIARQIDRYNAQATALGAYLRLLSEKGLDWRHYDEIPVDKESQAHAMVLARRAVASPLAKDVSASLSRGALTGGNVSVGRSLWQFQNVFQDQWSNIRHDLWRAGIREKNPRLAAIAFVSLVAMGLAEFGVTETIKSGINTLTGYKPKKELTLEQKMAIEAARRLPFGGQLTTAVLYQRSGIPAIDAPLDVIASGTRAATAKKPAAQDKAKIRAASGALQLMGVPGASQIGELIEKSY